MKKGVLAFHRALYFEFSLGPPLEGSSESNNSWTSVKDSL